MEALTRRVLRGDQLPSTNALVDIGNIVSLLHLLPVGGHSIDDLTEDIELRLATGKEDFVQFGSTENEHPCAARLFLLKAILLTRRWPWRQANHTLAERMRDYLIGVIGIAKVERAPAHFGSIDMGNVSHVVPAVHVLVDVTQGKLLCLHTPDFREAAATPYADETTPRAGKALALTGYDMLTNASFREEALAEFKRNLEK